MFNGLIIVGLGNHTKNKILPALNELSIPVKGIVSSTKLSYYENIKIYSDLNSLINSDKISHCIISTTPSKQVIFIKQLSLAGIKTLIEKPAFVSENDFNGVESYLKTNNLLTEGMMYRFSEGFKYFKKNNPNSCKTLNITFILPTKLKDLLKSFRGDDNVKHSIIYDIGIYIIDMLWVMKIFNYEISNINLNKFENNIIKQLQFTINTHELDLCTKIHINIGHDNYYKNQLKLSSKNINFSLSPFFWGRKGEITLENINLKNKILQKIKSQNSLKKMIQLWLLNEENKVIEDLSDIDRFRFIACHLEKLEKEVLKYV